MSRKKQKTTAFEKAVSATPDIQNCCKSGLTALGNYSSKIQLGSTCEGSVAIDECVSEKYPQENRWDYVFGYRSEAIFVEVHSAYTSEV